MHDRALPVGVVAPLASSSGKPRPAPERAETADRAGRRAAAAPRTAGRRPQSG